MRTTIIRRGGLGLLLTGARVGCVGELSTVAADEVTPPLSLKGGGTRETLASGLTAARARERRGASIRPRELMHHTAGDDA